MSCDSSFVPDVGETPSESLSERVRTVQKWYKEALSEEQGKPPVLLPGANKVGEDSTLAEVLAAMVRQHPPDWDGMETWDNGIGGYWGATLLGGNPTNASDRGISVVRTLIADVDENGQVLSGQLVEFVAPDLDELQFRDYVVQWISGDLGDPRILVSEYTIGYAHTQAFVYEKDKDPRPVTVQLVERLVVGKIAAGKKRCYITGRWEIEICEPYTGDRPPESEVCVSTEYIELTCVEEEDDDGDDTGGGSNGDDDGDDDDDNSGGFSGRDDDDCSNCDVDLPGGGGDETKKKKLELICPRSVNRGDTAKCTAEVKSDDPNDTGARYTFDWSSSIGASLSTVSVPRSEWEGTATKRAKITVKVESENLSESETVRVRSRTDFALGKLSAPLEYSNVLRINNVGGIYYVNGAYSVLGQAKIIVGPTSESGTGPWNGTFMVGRFPELSPEMYISNDYADPGPTYPPRHNIDAIDEGVCPDAPALDSLAQSYDSVNNACGTTIGFIGMKNALKEHEEDHEDNYNTCLSQTSIFDELEDFVDSDRNTVNMEIKKEWDKFAPAFKAAGSKAKGYAGTSRWFYRSGGAWIYHTSVVEGHGLGRPNCN